MELPTNLEKIIQDEFEEIVKLIQNSNSPDDKLYYFSASFGVLHRVLNIHFNPTLVFMHQVLQHTHNLFGQRLGNIRPSNSLTNSFPPELFDSLFSNFESLVSSFRDQKVKEIYESLEKITNVGYATTGNGFYLYIRGKLKI